MTRVMILWLLPSVLSRDEALGWTRAHMDRLLADRGVRAASLRPLRRVSDAEPPSYDWLLEVDLASREAWDSSVADLVADLRLLGMRPLVTVPGEIVARVPG